jgi:ribose-phosphate pyrophosphokinase
MSAAVSGKSVVIYDDMIRTGGSLIAAARAYKSAGAVKLTAIATHGVFPEDALERLRATGLFSAIACTDTHPRARELAGASLHVAPIASVLAQALEENL